MIYLKSIINIISDYRHKINVKYVNFEVIMALKHLSIRIDDEMLDKLHVVADYEGRSANSQIIILIRDCIEKYEQVHGKINIGGSKNG